MKSLPFRIIVAASALALALPLLSQEVGAQSYGTHLQRGSESLEGKIQMRNGNRERQIQRSIEDSTGFRGSRSSSSNESTTQCQDCPPGRVGTVGKFQRPIKDDRIGLQGYAAHSSSSNESATNCQDCPSGSFSPTGKFQRSIKYNTGFRGSRAHSSSSSSSHF